MEVKTKLGLYIHGHDDGGRGLGLTVSVNVDGFPTFPLCKFMQTI